MRKVKLEARKETSLRKRRTLRKVKLGPRKVELGPRKVELGPRKVKLGVGRLCKKWARARSHARSPRKDDEATQGHARSAVQFSFDESL